MVHFTVLGFVITLSNTGPASCSFHNCQFVAKPEVRVLELSQKGAMYSHTNSYLSWTDAFFTLVLGANCHWPAVQALPLSCFSLPQYCCKCAFPTTSEFKIETKFKIDCESTRNQLSGSDLTLTTNAILMSNVILTSVSTTT